MKFRLAWLALAPLLSGAAPQSSLPELGICKRLYRAPVVTYRASVDWGSARISGRLLVGAMDTSGVIWLQATNGRFLGHGSESVTFNVSDVSLYPLEFGVYRLTDEAFREYRAACQQGQCFVSPQATGVERLTEITAVESARDAMPCPS